MAKRPVPKYDFKAFGAAIKAARTGRKESRKKVSDEMFISPRYLGCSSSLFVNLIVLPPVAVLLSLLFMLFLLARCAPQNLLDISAGQSDRGFPGGTSP